MFFLFGFTVFFIQASEYSLYLFLSLGLYLFSKKDTGWVSQKAYKRKRIKRKKQRKKIKRKIVCLCILRYYIHTPFYGKETF